MTRLVIFTLAWCGGILLAQAGLVPWPWLLAGIPAALVLVLGWWRKQWARRIAAILVALLLGSLRFMLAPPNINASHIAWFNDSQVLTCEAVVITAPEPRPYDTRLQVRVEMITLSNGTTFPARGRMQIYAPPYSEIRYGDKLRFHGTPTSPPVYEGFNYRDYLMRHGVLSLMRDTEPEIIAHKQANRVVGMLLAASDYLHQHLLAILPEPSASLLSGILLGIERGIPDDLNEDFITTGTSHIIAISGFNLTLIAGFIASLSQRILKTDWLRLVLSLSILWIYVIFVGAAPAVMRAGVMATVIIIARSMSRGSHGPTSLATSVLLLSAINPWVLWDAGFQLSFAATAGLIWYAEPWTKAFERWLERTTSSDKTLKWVSWLSDNLIITLAAQLTTLGVIVGTFRRISLVSLLTNILILPVQNYIMILGAVALFASLFNTGLGRIIALPVWTLLSYTITCVERTAGILGTSLSLEWATDPVIIIYYLILIVGTWWLRHDKSVRQLRLLQLKQIKPWMWFCVVTVLLLLLTKAYFLPDGKLHVIALDGPGDATLVITPSGKQVLIDGGADGQQILSQIGKFLPVTDRNLDAVILTAPDADHITGLIDVVQRYAVDTIISPLLLPKNNSAMEWQRLLNEALSARTRTIDGDFEWNLGDGVMLRSVTYSADPEAPLVLLIEFETTRIFLGGALTAQGEAQMAQQYGESLQSNVFFVPRQGDDTTASPALLQSISPTVIVISTDADTPPSDYVLARLHGFDVYRTDQHGSVEITTDGQKLNIDVDH